SINVENQGTTSALIGNDRFWYLDRLMDVILDVNWNVGVVVFAALQIPIGYHSSVILDQFFALEYHDSNQVY
nr:hypothetical protein [Tanacetum cinerariifolium]